MTYAPEHEKELLNRSHRCRMGVSQAPSSASQQAGTAQVIHSTRQDTQCGLLRPQERLSLATTLGARVSALGDGLVLVQEVANRRNLRAA